MKCLCLILKELHNYVPTEKVTLDLTLPTGDLRGLDSKIFHRILLGGDQLTAAHTHSSCLAHVDHGSSGKRLCEVLPVIGTIHQVCEIVEHENQVVRTSGVDTKPSFAKELNVMVKELEEQQVFTEKNRKPLCYQCCMCINRY